MKSVHRTNRESRLVIGLDCSTTGTKAIAFDKKERIAALHPSSSTCFIAEAITGSESKINDWVCGVVTPRGMSVEMAMALGSTLTPHEESTDPGGLQGTWVIEKGQLGGEVRPL